MVDQCRNLAECNAPLFTYIADLAHHGAKTVRTVYGCKGWTAHTVANVWGFTARLKAWLGTLPVGRFMDGDPFMDAI